MMLNNWTQEAEGSVEFIQVIQTEYIIYIDFNPKLDDTYQFDKKGEKMLSFVEH